MIIKNRNHMPESIRDGRGTESIHTIHLNPSHHCFQSRRCRAKQSKQQSCFTMHFHGYNLELCSHLVVFLAGFLRLLTFLFCTIIWTSQEHFYRPKQNKTKQDVSNWRGKGWRWRGGGVHSKSLKSWSYESSYWQTLANCFMV